jgi:hypothetical protein
MAKSAYAPCRTLGDRYFCKDHGHLRQSKTFSTENHQRAAIDRLDTCRRRCSRQFLILSPRIEDDASGLGLEDVFRCCVLVCETVNWAPPTWDRIES